MLNSFAFWICFLQSLSGAKHHAEIIDFQNAQIEILKRQLGGKRLKLSDRERRRLAVKSKILGRKQLRELSTIVTPDTLLRWHQKLIAKKWTFPKTGNKGRPRTAKSTEELICRMARENPRWGYTRILGAMHNLGYSVSRTTVANILHTNGIEPAPNRPTAWKTFLRAHWKSLAAMDFTTVEVWTKSGLTTFFVLVVMQLETRRVCIAGITQHPDSDWTRQVARNLTDEFDGFLRDSTHLIMDRDCSFLPFRGFLEDHTEISSVVLPPKSPNLNAFVERFMKSIKTECLNQMVFFGKRSLQKTLREYVDHYHHERNHQGLDNQIPFPERSPPDTTKDLKVRNRLGGMLRYYYRPAA